MYAMQKSVSSEHVAGGSMSSSANIHKSRSVGNCIVEKKRGFKPSDRHDPAKKEYLISLSKQIWQRKEGSSTVTKGIDLQKIFTPATDAEEIIPKNRKLYASSAFYSPSLHPTVEDQVELARRISHSLSDISNQQSKGQSMYVNRKKRSVKWVHEGEGQAETKEYIDYEETKENDYERKTSSTYQSSASQDKLPLKLVMNPRGQIRDITTARDELYSETGLMSPDKCAELVNALNAPKGKGAELFAKRRKKAEKWVVDETNAATTSPSGVPYNGHKPTSPSFLPAYSDVGIQRVQLNMQQDEIQQKYANQGVQMVKTPWEAALQTGSASAAFEGGRSPVPPPPVIVEPVSYEKPQTYAKPVYNSQRDLAYRPNVAQGWKAPPVALPRDHDVADSSDSEDEIIHYMDAAKGGAHDIVNCFAKSPELMVSDAKSHLLQYDNAVRELQTSIVKKTQRSELELYQQQQRGKVAHIKQQLQVQAEAEKQVAQQKAQRFYEQEQAQQHQQRHLQQYHVPVSQAQPLQAQPLSFQSYYQPPKAAVAVPVEQSVHYQQQHHLRYQQQQPHVEHPTKFTHRDSYPFQSDFIIKASAPPPPVAAIAEEIEYVKVPVKDLISTFEKQTQEEIEKRHAEIKARSTQVQANQLQKQHYDVYLANQFAMQKQKRLEEEQKALQQAQAAYEYQQYQEQVEFTERQRQQQLQDELQPQQELYEYPERQTQPQESPYEYEDHTDYSERQPQPQPEPQYAAQDLYVPREIPLDGYVPPPVEKYLPKQTFPTYQPQPIAPQPTHFPITKPVPQSPPTAKYQPHQQYQHQPQQQPSPIAFNPSPLSYDKLAKFQQNEPNGNYNGNHSHNYAAVRKPLAVPATKVRNLSPVPFGTPPVQSPVPSRPASQQLFHDYLQPQPQPQPNYNYNQYDRSQTHSTANSRVSSVDLSHCQNFNTAARGWGKAHDTYRPVTFAKQQAVADLPYTDF